MKSVEKPDNDTQYRIEVERVAAKVSKHYPDLSYGSRVKIAKILLSESRVVNHELRNS
jgi:hypothetical protein